MSATQNLASKSILLRRVYLDLIGVPPTLEQIQQFESDTRPDAYQRIVDQLLERPQYGERWGRHWMDVWRYTDWYGLGAQLRNSQKHIWHWRDWIIESLNNDVGYDQMILEMLAADELYPTDLKKIRATGFLARNYYLFNRTTWLDSTLEHTGKAFLGLTVNCAKCHDHKYDPISQKDYYQLRAVFEPHQVRLDPLPGATDLEKDGLPRVFDAHPEAKTYVHIRGDEKLPDKSTEIQPGIPAFFKYQGFKPASIGLPAESYNPSVQSFVLKDHLELVDREIDKHNEAVDEARKKFDQFKAADKKHPEVETVYTAYPLNNQTAKDVFIDDSFESFDQSIWKKVNGDWKVAKGRLVQSDTGSVSRIVESRSNHPANFLLEAELSVSGGQMWRSFGIRFDADSTHEKTVYLSAYTDSKVQVSFANNGNTTYPTNALAKLPIKLNRSYRLRVAVFEKRINVSVDGNHLVSFEFPVARQPGKLQLMSFDSVAAFDRVKVIGLPKEVSLLGGKNGSPLTVGQAKLKLDLAQARLHSELLRRSALQKGHDATRVAKMDTHQAQLLKASAAKAKVDYEIALKEAEKCSLKVKRQGVGGRENDRLKKALAKLDQQIESLKKKYENPGDDYLLIRASRKALEGPDEKPDSRNQPYPKTSTGRRSAFAKWIVESSNPLTARVAVNQIWMRHFGRPLLIL